MTVRRVAVAVAVVTAAVILAVSAAYYAKALDLRAVGVGAAMGGGTGPVTAVGALRRPVAARVAPRPTPARIVAQRPSTAGVSGPASWYCKPGRSACTVGTPTGCYCAAAGPAVRAMFGGRYMGRTVTVSRGGSAIQVRIVDWCGCPGGRVLDLYAAAFDALGSLSSGTMTVRVSR